MPVYDADVIGRIESGIDRGGWQVSGEVINDADKMDWNQEVQVWFDAYTVAGWEQVNQPAFSGHITLNEWQRLFQSSRSPFTGGTADAFMKRGRVQGIFFKDVPAPANQHQIANMTYAHIVEHILGKSGEFGHANLRRGIWPEGIVDVNIDFANSSPVDEYDLKEGGYWTRLKELANADTYYIYVSKANVVNFIPHPMFATLPPATLTITDSLMLAPMRFRKRDPQRIGQVKINGQTPAGTQISAFYPTDPTGSPVIQRSGYVAKDNTKMAQVAERIYRFETRDYSVQVELNGGIGLFLELLDRVAITYSSPPDGIDWTDKMFWVHGITVEFRRDFTAKTRLMLEAEN